MTVRENLPHTPGSRGAATASLAPALVGRVLVAPALAWFLCCATPSAWAQAAETPAPTAATAPDAAPAPTAEHALPAWPPTQAAPDGKPGAFSITLHVGADGHALPVTVVLPEEMPTGAGRLPVVIALPPGKGNAQMCAVVRELYWDTEARARGYLLLVPEVFGQSLQADGADVAAALFGWLDAAAVPYDASRVTLAGVSNGGMGAFHLALAAPARLAALLVLPGAHEGPPEAFAALAAIPVRMLVGADDEEWRTPGERNLAELKAAGVSAELLVVPGQGHVIQVPGSEMFDWIDDHGTRKPQPAPDARDKVRPARAAAPADGAPQPRQ